MNVILSKEEQEVKVWTFDEVENNYNYENNVIITDKRFIYQKQLKDNRLEKHLSRYEVALDEIKGVNAFYGSVQNKLWLLIGILGIFIALFSTLFFINEDIEAGIFCIIVGVLLAIFGIYFHIKPEKCPIKTKKLNFAISLETKTPKGSKYALGAGKEIVLKGKSNVNWGIFAVLMIAGVIPAFIYLFIKKSEQRVGLDLPEETAIEIIETLGSLIF